MSSTIGSPARITRSDASWCGDAEFGPDATIANMRLFVTLVDEPLADLARDVRLGPSDQRAGGDLRRRPDRRHGRPSRSSAISSASLIIRRSRSTVDAERVRRRVGPALAWSRSRCIAEHRVRHGDAASPWARAADTASAYGSSVSSQVRSPIGVASPASAAPRSSRGTTRNGAVARPEDEHRQALERHRLVAGQVAQVRPDADEQRVELAPPVSPRRHAAGARRSARAGTVGRARDRHDPLAGERTAQPGGDRRRPVLEQLAVGEHALGAARPGPACAARWSSCWPDREHARAGRARTLDRGQRRRTRAPSCRRSRARRVEGGVELGERSRTRGRVGASGLDSARKRDRTRSGPAARIAIARRHDDVSRSSGRGGGRCREP